MAEMDIKIRLVLLDREFFSVDAIGRLQENNVKFLMPCKNTGNVAAALREFAQKKREKISGNVIENNRGSATYSMMITDRKGAKDSDVPEERYIWFETNHPAIKTEVYAKRWGIETGRQNRGVQGQDLDFRHGIADAMLLLFSGIVQ